MSDQPEGVGTPTPEDAPVVPDADAPDTPAAPASRP